MSTATIVISLLLLSSGVSMAFVGLIVALLTAFGNRQYGFGIGMAIFAPLALVYCVLNRDKTAWGAKLLYGGVTLALLGVLLVNVAGRVGF